MNENRPPQPAEAGVRRAARVLVVDEHERVLLFRFVDPVSADPFWITPGGGLDDDESFEDAARRELFEETGITVDNAASLGPCVWTRQADIRYGHRRFQQYEQFYLLRIDACAIDTGAMLDYEVTDLVEHRWWTLDAIARSEERFAPRDLASRLTDLLVHPLPPVPLRLGG